MFNLTLNLSINSVAESQTNLAFIKIQISSWTFKTEWKTKKKYVLLHIFWLPH